MMMIKRWLKLSCFSCILQWQLSKDDEVLPVALGAVEAAWTRGAIMSIGGARGACLVAHFGNKTRIAHDEGCGNDDSTDDSNGQQNRQQHQPTASSLHFSTSSGSRGWTKQCNCLVIFHFTLSFSNPSNRYPLLHFFPTNLSEINFFQVRAHFWEIYISLKV